MTRLGRALWSAVAVAAVTGLLLSLVVLTRPTADPAPAAEVLGRASVASGPAAQSTGREPRAVLRAGTAPAPRVRRSSAALGDLPAPRSVPPRQVSIPTLGLELDVRPTGLERGRQMRLPQDPRDLGWYRYGPAPGDRGSTVLAGHVDSREYGIGPLAALGSVRPGARVEVTLRSGRRLAYRVDSVESFDRQALPAEVFSREGRSRIRLVTCTGAFLPESGGYQQNLVVTAVPVRE